MRDVLHPREGRQLLGHRLPRRQPAPVVRVRQASVPALRLGHQPDEERGKEAHMQRPDLRQLWHLTDPWQGPLRRAHGRVGEPSEEPAPRGYLRLLVSSLCDEPRNFNGRRRSSRNPAAPRLAARRLRRDVPQLPPRSALLVPQRDAPVREVQLVARAGRLRANRLKPRRGVVFPLFSEVRALAPRQHA